MKKKTTLKKDFLTGIAIFLPLGITLVVITFIVNLLTKPFTGFVTSILCRMGMEHLHLYVFSPEQTLKYTSQFLILVFLFFFTLGLGFVAQWFFVKSFLHFSEKLLQKIPFVRKIHKTSQDIIKNLFSKEKPAFQQVVLFPYPHENSYSLGFISSHSLDDRFTSVFVPTAPNPTSGFLLMVEKKDMILLNLKVNDALKYIISCGVVMESKEISS